MANGCRLLGACAVKYDDHGKRRSSRHGKLAARKEPMKWPEMHAPLSRALSQKDSRLSR